MLYLRALGAKVGRDVAIFSRNVPVCTDLLTIGDGTVIRKESFVSCYRAHDGVIQTGPVTLGADVFVGEKTVLDIGTSMGDGAQLGHTSSLHSGQAVPAGEHWHGSPAERTEVDYRTVAPASCSVLRRVVFTLVQLVNLLVVFLPLGFAALRVLFVEVPLLARLLDSGSAAFQTWKFYLECLVASAVLFFGFTLVGFVVVVTVPRLLNLIITPGPVYRLYGIHYWVHRLIARLTNRKFFTELFGDSSYIVGYLRSSGYKLTPVVQTGSNFGMAVQHENPFLSSVGSGTVVADGLSLLNADYSSTSFRVSRGVDRARQLPRQPHRLPRAGPHRRQLPARHEGPGPDRGRGPGGRGPAGLAQLRDPADGRARQQPRRAGPRRAPPPPAPPRTGTTPSPSRCGC